MFVMKQLIAEKLDSASCQISKFFANGLGIKIAPAQIMCQLI